MGQLREKWKSAGKILMGMYVVTAVLLLMLALAVHFLEWGDKAISVGICAVDILSCVAGGVLAGKVQKQRKFLWGLLLGFLYAVTVLVLSLAAKQGAVGTLSCTGWNFVLCLLSGMFGGMIS